MALGQVVTVRRRLLKRIVVTECSLADTLLAGWLLRVGLGWARLRRRA